MIRSYFRDLCKLYNLQNCTLHNKSIDHRFVINSLKDGNSGFQLSRFLIFEQLYFLPSTPSPPVNLISGPPLKILNILIMSGGLFLQELTPFTNIQFIIRNLNLEEKNLKNYFDFTLTRTSWRRVGWGERFFKKIYSSFFIFFLCYKL